MTGTSLTIGGRWTARLSAPFAARSGVAVETEASSNREGLLRRTAYRAIVETGRWKPLRQLSLQRMIKTAQQLIQNPSDLRPHVVLLGAGASRAGFPKGDATGQQLPVMDDFVDVLELHSLIEDAGIGAAAERNFEAIYSHLASEPGHANTLRKIERHIDAYFSALSLPDQATIYDRILISLRSTDAVFTFNWDPFLFDAYQRNRDAVPLPGIFFLHGNVRIGACTQHDRWGPRKGRCPVCSAPFADVPLLYPIAQKDYSSNT